MSSVNHDNLTDAPSADDLGSRRRSEILDAAIAIFARTGFRQTDVQEIADRAGVGKGTVYRYFCTKEELFLKAVDRCMVRLKQCIDEAIADAKGPLEQLEIGLRAYLDFFDRNPEAVELFIQERAEFSERGQGTYFQYREENVGRWRDLVSELMADGTMRRMDVDAALSIMGYTAYGAVMTAHLSRRGKGELARQADAMLDVVFHGLLEKRAT